MFYRWTFGQDPALRRPSRRHAANCKRILGRNGEPFFSRSSALGALRPGGLNRSYQCEIEKQPGLNVHIPRVVLSNLSSNWDHATAMGGTK